ncbi:MAG: DUF4239 domain-containing protein [Verrucomicrobiae bacterium]|nr:DUF4239 domain-containing protein [Verrucomicrobiae bacterium]
MSQILLSGIFAVGLFFGVLGCSRLGWRLGVRRFANEGDDGQAGLGAVEGAVYGLMGLLIAFTFTGAASRFDHRRDLITAEVNAIGTAWLRLDALDEPSRQEVRGLFRQYLDGNLELTQHGTRENEILAVVAEVGSLQQAIWDRVNEAAWQAPAKPIPQLLYPALNEMFDSFQRRILSTRQHPPLPVYLMLSLTVLTSALLSGFGMAKAKRQSRVHLFGFSAVLALSIYLILDLEYPRLGLVRVDSFDQALLELRDSMDSPGGEAN